MKNNLLNILTISAIITTIGFIMDGDPKILGVLLRFTEYFLMLGIVFLLFLAIYFAALFVKRNFRKLRS
ncbi:hypothetical protein [Kaistella yonginensis]|uniref:hypothetical protein n=1 Tax=Kaistella yonginensis TaxID=658267 RepID=UPI0025B5662B|nr:hypothetical protein [Kaistella yonginensis]MDN3607180.1 hypothetical protein [Kaistella yonginensis]